MNYPTSDLGFASLLHAIEYPLKESDIKDPSHIIFIFEIPKEDIEKVTLLHEAYKVGNASIDALTYYRSQKDLKFIVKEAYEQKRNTK